MNLYLTRRADGAATCQLSQAVTKAVTLATNHHLDEFTANDGIADAS